MSDTTVTVTEEQTLTTSVSTSDPISLETLNNVGDVDMTTKTNGSTLIYNSTTSKWTASTLLENQTMEGGEF